MLTLAARHGLGPAEYERLRELLGREPDEIEMGVMGAMWSEHCSYKSSKVHLRKLASSSPRLVQGPGENAGIVELMDGWCAAFKIESHNHPSYIEPFQGAATGVGGIIRDILAMGARPIALLDSLRFGWPDHPKTKYLVNGVVSGVGSYGNCVGVPTVGGEIQFHRSYNRNNLVNAFCLGIVRKDRIIRGRAEGIGNPLIYTGAKTGRDGIHGATMASAAFGSKDEEVKRPNVQIADPFMEKLLIEACLEAIDKGLVLGMQDMGAAGIINSTSEMAGRGGNGVDLQLERVPLREPAMRPYEIVLSESQERMVLVVPSSRASEAVELFRKWGLNTEVFGNVTDHGAVRLLSDGREVGRIPVHVIVDGAPQYTRAFEADPRPAATPPPALREEPERIFKALLADPNLKSKRWVWEKYDWSVGTNTVLGPGSDAAVLRLKGSRGGIALTVDANPRWCFADPKKGTILTLLESFRNLACVGAEPVGVTNCLNFGNPENQRVMGQFAAAVAGLQEACKNLTLPIVSGNVSFYNETEGDQIHPTPALALVGTLEDVSKPVGASFRKDNQIIGLVGDSLGSAMHLVGSEALAFLEDAEGIPPYEPSFQKEQATASFLREALNAAIVSSVHDVSDGGLAVALMECCLGAASIGGIGARVSLKNSNHPIAELFGEGPPRFVISADADSAGRLHELASSHQVTFSEIGRTGGDALVLDPFLRIPLRALREQWEAPWR
ncbi:MAG: phosphoribosylformylglycinamidine synthase subunit PurL [Nitrospirae bacterium]|nr:phosphoribosylformylglycinamidine synthase subunit PurL [Nitrospirota bacterium]